MRNLWSDKDAKAAIREHAQKGVGEDLALRVYSAQLLGNDSKLVLHGGGNASVKTVAKDVSGGTIDVLFVKGSGHDMATMEANGFAAVQMRPLKALAGMDKLNDRHMENARRCHLLDCHSPTPSVEFLLHAFLPHKFCDHTHADAVLAIGNQKDGEKLPGEVFGKNAAIVPYTKPGFALAKKALEVFNADPGVKALILLKHGIFTFADTAKEAYGNMVDMVTLAEKRIKKAKGKTFAAAKLPAKIAPPAEVAPIVRGLCAVDGQPNASLKRPMILHFCTNDEILAYVNGSDIKRYANIGAVTPDHTIRTRTLPLIAPPPEDGDLDGFKDALNIALEHYADDSRNALKRHNFYGGALDPIPRVVLVPGLGLFGLGDNANVAKIAADLAKSTISVISGAEAIGVYASAPEADLLEVETWPMERAKLDEVANLPLAGHVMAVTGGAGAIGAATAKAFAQQGAEVAILDLDGDMAANTAKSINPQAFSVTCDVTNEKSVRGAFDAVCNAFGGVDIVVSNAGAAWQGTIGEVDDKLLRQSFELNFFGHQTVAQNAVRVMRAQGTGGCLLFNTSKQAVNPGKDFGPYGLPKAATMFLLRQYAVDHGHEGIRTGGVNADRIRSGLLTNDMIQSRAKARGLDDKKYMAGNLLGREVKAEDVAQAFVYLAKAKASTADILTVDGGNIAAALR